MERAQLVALLGSVVLLLIVLELVRRRRLLERYALLWIASGVALVALASTSGLLEKLAELFGVVDGPNALFVIAFGFVLFLLLSFSTVISSLTDQTKILAQRIAQLEEQLRRERGEQAPAGVRLEESRERERERVAP